MTHLTPNASIPKTLMDKLMDFRPNPDELDHIAALSRIYPPQQLKNKALMYLKILLFQHDCLLVQAIHALDQGEENLGSVMAITSDRRQLDIIFCLLNAIDTEFERAVPNCVEAYVDLCKRDAEPGKPAELDAKLTDLRTKLESIFKKSQDFLNE